MTGVELESQEVGGGDEARLERLAHAFLGQRRSRSRRPGPGFAPFSRSARRFSRSSSSFSHVSSALRRSSSPIVTPLMRSGLLTNLPSRGNHDGLATHAIERRRAGADQLDRLALFEDVLLQLLPVVVAPLEHARHERIKVVLPERASRFGARGAIDAATRPAARTNRRTAGFIRSLRGAKTRPG